MKERKPRQLRNLKNETYYAKKLLYSYTKPEKPKRFVSEIVFYKLDVILTKKKKTPKIRKVTRLKLNPYILCLPENSYSKDLNTRKNYIETNFFHKYYIPKNSFILNNSKPYYLICKGNHLFNSWNFTQIRKTRDKMYRLLESTRKPNVTHNFQRNYNINFHRKYTVKNWQSSENKLYDFKNKNAIEFLKNYRNKLNYKVHHPLRYNTELQLEPKNLKSYKDSFIEYNLSRNMFPQKFTRAASITESSDTCLAQKFVFNKYKYDFFSQLKGDTFLDKLVTRQIRYKSKITLLTTKLPSYRFPFLWYRDKFLIEERAKIIIYEKPEYFHTFLYLLKDCPELFNFKYSWEKEQGFAYAFSILPLSYWSHLQHWILNEDLRKGLANLDPLHNNLMLSRSRRILYPELRHRVQKRRGLIKVSTVKKNLYGFSKELPYTL